MNKILVGLLISFIVVGCSNGASKKNIYSLAVSRKGQIVKEEYYNGKTKADLNNIQSVSKSIISILVGIAIDKGFIESENSFIYQYFPESQSFSDQNKKSITIKHLLNHTSGLEWNGFLEHAAYVVDEDPIELVLNRKLLAEPGSEYNYHSGGTHLLSAIITKATGMTTLEFANQYLFGPLNFEEVIWEQLKDGYYDGAGFGLYLKTTDLTKIGNLVLYNGKYNNQQIVSINWIQKSFNESLKKDTKWGLRYSKHGYGWYSKMNGDEQILYAMGYGGQFILILPANDLVIVSTHNHDTPEGIDQQVDFLDGKLERLIEEFGK